MVKGEDNDNGDSVSVKEKEVASRAVMEAFDVVPVLAAEEILGIW